MEVITAYNEARQTEVSIYFNVSGFEFDTTPV